MSTVIHSELGQLLKDANDLLHHSKAAIAFSQDAVDALEEAKHVLQVASIKLHTLKNGV